DFLDGFRKADNMRYKLMPYIYAQAKDASEKGLPMLRALFVEYPNDPGAWLIDDQYLFGSDMLVAPLFENITERNVYLPGGKWIDYQTGKVYNKGWHTIKAGDIPIIVLVKDGTVIPHIKLAQSTKDMDWSNIELKVYAADATQAKGKLYLPNDSGLHELILDKSGSGFILKNNPVSQKTNFKITN
ncbi:MAG TPA: alpha-xylosidase, partial [Flavobacteriaceae bacterium]